MRALALFSGGLDSMLSVLIIRKQGIVVEGVYFETPFFPAERAKRSAKEIDLPLKIKDVTYEMLEIIKSPKFGYGKGLNPCLDCRLLMLKKACKMREEENYNFIITGEVIGQRPLTQKKQMFLKLDKECPCREYIVRPLSARLLPQSLPEKQGLIKREKLFSIQGRSRREQIGLAEIFGIKDYPSPAGGCLLTDKGFSFRLKDLLEYKKEILDRDLYLLKIGRHFRLNKNTKVIVGRNKKENFMLLKLSTTNDVLIHVVDYPAPIVLVPDGGDIKGRLIAKQLAASYSDAPKGKVVKIEIKKGKDVKIEEIQVLPKQLFRNYLIQC